MLSTTEAAAMLDISPARVRKLLNSGQLNGSKIGRTWVVDEESVRQRLHSTIKPGRPKKMHYVPGVSLKTLNTTSPPTNFTLPANK